MNDNFIADKLHNAFLGKPLKLNKIKKETCYVIISFMGTAVVSIDVENKMPEVVSCFGLVY